MSMYAGYRAFRLAEWSSPESPIRITTWRVELTPDPMWETWMYPGDHHEVRVYPSITEVEAMATHADAVAYAQKVAAQMKPPEAKA